LLREAALERAVDLLLDHLALLAGDLGDLGDHEELRAIEHPLLAEREVLGARQEREGLQYFDDVVNGAGAHPIRVVLETPFPVLMIVDLAVAQEPEQPLNLLVADRASEANAVDVVQWYEHGGLIGDHAQVVEPACRSENGFCFDALHNAETVIWVNDLVTNLKCHTSPKRRADVGRGKRAVSSPLSIPEGCMRDQRKRPKIRVFCTFLRPPVHTRGEHRAAALTRWIAPKFPVRNGFGGIFVTRRSARARARRFRRP